MVVGGHVDHGKSTLVGRLLAETDSVPPAKVEAVRILCERTAKVFEYAFLVDALRDERAQGVTIDVGRAILRGRSQDYLFLDAPGHVEFVRNMVTGAAQADAALLVIDAHGHIQENSRRHAMLLQMLGIRQLLVVVNKMDLVAYAEAAFESVVRPFSAFLSRFDIGACQWIPAAARLGKNVTERAAELGWYKGPTVLQALETFVAEPIPIDGPFRLPVQDVYKFTRFDDDRRIIAGTVETGRASVGDELLFLPSNRRARIQRIEVFGAPDRNAVLGGQAVGLRMTPEVFVTRGELAVRVDEPRPLVAAQVRVSLFWLARVPLAPGMEVVFRVHTSRVAARVVSIDLVTDAKEQVGAGDATAVLRHDIAQCTLELCGPIAFDVAGQCTPTSRFVLEMDGNICGGGSILIAQEQRTGGRPVDGSSVNALERTRATLSVPRPLRLNL